MKRLILLVVLFWGVSQAFAFDIVSSEKRAIIVIPDNAVSCVAEAANELQYHVKQSSGVSLDIVRESNKPDLEDGFIYLGPCKATAKVGIVVSEFDRGSFVIKTVGGNLYMAGQDGSLNWLRLTGEDNSAGTLFAVYEFLDRFMGVRWLWPGKLGEVIPHRDTITLDAMDLEITLPLSQARLRVRWPAEGWASNTVRGRFLHDQAVWLRRHRFGWDQSLDMGHAFTQHWKRFSETQPEIFNELPDGTRQPDPTYHGGADSLISMCVSQPALWKIIVDDWKANRTKVRRHIDISENDTDGRCTCPNCLAWDSGQQLSLVDTEVSIEKAREAFERRDRQWAGHLGSLSDRYAKFFLAVQKLAQETDPEAVVMGYAYANTVDPPVETKLNERVIVGFVPQIMYPWTDVKCQRSRKQLDGWAATGAKLMYRPNYMLSGHCMPINVAKKLGEAFSSVFQRGLTGTDFDSLTGQYGTQGLNLYVLTRLHRDGTVPVEEVFDEYYAAFGPAEAMVRKYFEHWEHISDAVTDETFQSPEAKMKSPEGGHWAKFYRIADVVFTPEVMAKGQAILNEAQKAAGEDATAQQRVAFLQKGLKNVELTIAAQAAYRQYKQSGNIDIFATTLKELDSYRASIEGDYVADMGFLAKFENATWSRSLMEMLGKDGENLPDTWKFMWDPQNEGISESWQAVQFDDSAWFDIGVDSPWEKQPVGKQWEKEHRVPYNGFAWYRNEFEVKPSGKSKQYRLGFGAVDEACTVWLNGQLILKKPYPYKGDVDSWQKAFDVDITEYIVFDKPNVLAVRVEDTEGAGGIWKPVQLITTDMLVEDSANLISNPGFEDGQQSWKRSIMAGKFLFEIDSVVSHSGNKSAKLECTEVAPRTDKPQNPNSWARWHRGIPVKKGKAYKFRCFVKTQPDFIGKIMIFLTGDAEKKTRTASCLNTQGRWVELKIENYIAAVDKAGVYLNQYGIGEVWFDDVELVQK